LPPSTRVSQGIIYQDYWILVVSNSGDSAILFHQGLDKSAENHWLSTSDLADVSVAPAQSLDWRMALSGSAIAVAGSPGCGVVLQERLEEPRCICPKCKGAVLASFGDGMLFLERAPAASYKILDSRGHKVLDRNKGFGADSIGGVSGSARSNRAAFVINGALRLSLFDGWGSHYHVIVVDADRKREVVDLGMPDESTRVDDWQVFGQIAPAISPDGKSLAVLTGHYLTLWAIP